MAFYDDKDEEEQQVEAAGTGQQIGKGSAIIDSQGSSEGPNPESGQGTASAPAAAGGSTTSPFVGINQYIESNKPQSAGLANKVGTYVQGQGQTARDTLAENQTKFNTDVDSKTVNLNKGLINQASNLGPGAGAEALNQNQVQEFQKMRDANYTGPTSLEQSQYWDPISQTFNKANTVTQQSTDSAGQRDLLGQFQQDTRGRINQGALSFDSALLQGDEDARKILADYASKNADLSGLLSGAQNDALTRASQAAQTTAQTKKAVQDAFTGSNSVQKKLENNVSAQVAGAQGEAKRQAEEILALIKAGQNLTDSQLKKAGINRADYEKLLADRSNFQKNYDPDAFGDLSTYGKVGSLDQINAQTLATAQDYARYAALNRLMGTNEMFLSDPSLAGTANMDVLDDYNITGASGDISSLAAQKAAAEAQRQAEIAAEAKREKEKRLADQESNAIVTGAAIGSVIPGTATGAVVGGLIGKATCFLKNTPILMEDGSFKKVQDLQLGEMTAFGGMVVGTGQVICTQLIEYKGQYTSLTHAIFDGVKWVRAENIDGGKLINLDIPVIVYPIVNEKHIMITDNETVYADLIEHDDSVGCSDDQKLEILNRSEYVEQTKEIEKEIKWTFQNTKQVITKN